MGFYPRARSAILDLVGWAKSSKYIHAQERTGAIIFLLYDLRLLWAIARLGSDDDKGPHVVNYMMCAFYNEK